MRKAVKLNESGLTESIVFNVKVYPMGKVTVSMKSYIETKIGEIIIANFQAKAEQHDWSVFGNEDYDDDKSRGISKSNSVAIQRALLMEQYNWQLEVLIPKDNKLETLNVDRYGTNGLKMDTIKNTLNPTFSNFGYMPQAISLKWQRSDTIKFLAGFRFDEQELITAFHNIDKPNGKQQITIQVVAKNDTTALQASIRSGVKSFKLKNLNKEKVYSDKVYH